jgi:hypothetical protein
MIKDDQSEDFFYCKNESEIETDFEDNIVKIIKSLEDDFDESENIILIPELKNKDDPIENGSSSTPEGLMTSEIFNHSIQKKILSSTLNLIEEFSEHREKRVKQVHKRALWSEFTLNKREIKNFRNCSVRILKLSTTLFNKLFQVVSLDTLGNIPKLLEMKQVKDKGEIEFQDSFSKIKVVSSSDNFNDTDAFNQKPLKRVKNLSEKEQKKDKKLSTMRKHKVSLSKILKKKFEKKITSNLPQQECIKPILKQSFQSMKIQKKVSFCSKIFIRRFNTEDDDQS